MNSNPSCSQRPFSVVIPTFNRLAFLKEAVASVTNQTLSGWELIVVDDGSTDGTDKFLRQLNDPRVTVVSQDNHGVARARNRGIERSTGEWIAFLDSDDLWRPRKLESFWSTIKQRPDAVVVHSEEEWQVDGRVRPQRPKHAKPDGDAYERCLELCCIGMSAAVVRRSLFFDTVGLFDETLTACEDYDFWLRVTSRFPVVKISEALTIKRGGREDQLSSTVWGLDRFRVRALEKMILSGSLNSFQRGLTMRALEDKCAVFAAGAKKRGRCDEAECYATLPETCRKRSAEAMGISGPL